MASKKTLIIGTTVLAVFAVGGIYFYGISNAAKGLSVNTFVRIHSIDVLGETTLSIDIEFINGSRNDIAFTYPYVRVFRADTKKQIAFSLPKDQKISIAKSSMTTVKDIRIKMNTIDLAVMAGELIKNVATGKAATIPLMVQIDSQLSGLLSVNFSLTDTADIDLSKYWNLIKGLFGKSTNGLQGTDSLLVGEGWGGAAHLIAANDTLIGVVANDNQTVVPFSVKKDTYLGRNPKIYNNKLSTFTTPYGDSAIGQNNDILTIDCLIDCQ